MIPTVNLPVPFDQIPAEVTRLQEHARALRAAADVTSKMIAAVQSGCPHKRTRTWTDYGGSSNSECLHCGKRT